MTIKTTTLSPDTSEITLISIQIDLQHFRKKPNSAIITQPWTHIHRNIDPRIRQVHIPKELIRVKLSHTLRSSGIRSTFGTLDGSGETGTTIS